jgi:hypothetical protein
VGHRATFKSLFTLKTALNATDWRKVFQVYNYDNDKALAIIQAGVSDGTVKAVKDVSALLRNFTSSF